MNRPPNPYRKEHLRLESEGDAAAGRGEYAESQRLWHQAALLRARGRREIAAAMEAAKTPVPAPTDTGSLRLDRNGPTKYGALIMICFLAMIVVGAIIFVVWAQVGAANECALKGEVWDARTGHCVEPRYLP